MLKLKVNLKRAWSERRAFQVQLSLFGSFTCFKTIHWAVCKDVFKVYDYVISMTSYFIVTSAGPVTLLLLFVLFPGLCENVFICFFVCLFFRRYSVVSRKNVCSHWYKCTSTLLKCLSKHFILFHQRFWSYCCCCCWIIVLYKAFFQGFSLLYFFISVCLSLFLSFFLLYLGYLTKVTFPWLPDLPWTWVHFSGVTQ